MAKPSRQLPPGITSHVKGKYKRIVYWLDARVTRADGTIKRVKKRNIPTIEQAEALLAKTRAEAFEGRHFNVVRKKAEKTVAEVWEYYEPAAKRLKSWEMISYCKVPVLKHLGEMRVIDLTEHEVEAYRDTRRGEQTRYKRAPSAQTLDHEVKILKRALTYAAQVKTKGGESFISSNPIAHVRLLNENNTRTKYAKEGDVLRFIEVTKKNPHWRHVLALFPIYFDTGMRKNELFGLPWEYVDLDDRCVRLPKDYTKEEEDRLIILTERCVEILTQAKKENDALEKPSIYCFPSPRTGKPFTDIRRAFKSATEAAGMKGLHLHDLRRSFGTNTVRQGVAESVVMKMGGWSTNSVFQRYNIKDESDVRAAVEKLDQARERLKLAPSPGNSGPNSVPTSDRTKKNP